MNKQNLDGYFFISLGILAVVIAFFIVPNNQLEKETNMETKQETVNDKVAKLEKTVNEQQKAIKELEKKLENFIRNMPTKREVYYVNGDYNP